MNSTSLKFFNWLCYKGDNEFQACFKLISLLAYKLVVISFKLIMISYLFKMCYKCDGKF